MTNALDNESEDGEKDYVYFRLKLLYHPSYANDPSPDRISFIAYITFALTVSQGLFGSAIPLNLVHMQGMECWIKVHKDDKQKVWVALSSWAKDIEGGNRTLSWEILKISKQKDIVANGISDFPNIPQSDW